MINKNNQGLKGNLNKEENYWLTMWVPEPSSLPYLTFVSLYVCLWMYVLVEAVALVYLSSLIILHLICYLLFLHVHVCVVYIMCTYILMCMTLV